jgi:hypothetical protein
VPLALLRGHLPRLEVETELGQPLADAVGMRAPLGLVELHDFKTIKDAAEVRWWV